MNEITITTMKWIKFRDGFFNLNAFSHIYVVENDFTAKIWIEGSAIGTGEEIVLSEDFLSEEEATQHILKWLTNE